MTLGYPRTCTVSGFKGQGHRVSKFILHTSTLHTRTAIHRHSLGFVTSQLRFCGCLVHASLTFARWRNQSSAWVWNLDRVPSDCYHCVCHRQGLPSSCYSRSCSTDVSSATTPSTSKCKSTCLVWRHNSKSKATSLSRCSLLKPCTFILHNSTT